MARMPRAYSTRRPAHDSVARAHAYTRKLWHTTANRRGPDRRGVIVESHREIVASPRSCARPASEEKSLSTKLPRAVMRMRTALCRCMRRPMCRTIGVCRPMAMRRPIGIRRSLVMRRPIGMMRRPIGMRRRRSICLRRSGNSREDQTCDRHRKYRSNHVVLH
jgi:hypothetical protein